MIYKLQDLVETFNHCIVFYTVTGTRVLSDGSSVTTTPKTEPNPSRRASWVKQRRVCVTEKVESPRGAACTAQETESTSRKTLVDLLIFYKRIEKQKNQERFQRFYWLIKFSPPRDPGIIYRHSRVWGPRGRSLSQHTESALKTALKTETPIFTCCHADVR